MNEMRLPPFPRLPAPVQTARFFKDPFTLTKKCRRELGDRHARLRAGWWQQARREADASPISLAHLSAEVWAAVKDERPVLAFNGLNPWPLRLWDLTEPDQLPGDAGGGGVGYGIGGAIGVALAHRERGRLCVSLQPDGDLLYTPIMEYGFYEVFRRMPAPPKPAPPAAAKP